MPADPSRAARIAHLNDAFRRTMGAMGGRVACKRAGSPPCRLPTRPPFTRRWRPSTPSPPTTTPTANMTSARLHTGEQIFWKIDYYDANLEYGSDDPSRPEVTTRVLTIMFAREY